MILYVNSLNITSYLLALAFDPGDTGNGGRMGVAAPRSPPADPARALNFVAEVFAEASYGLATEVDWHNCILLQATGKILPLAVLKANAQKIEKGAEADPTPLKDAAEAHHQAPSSIIGPNGATPRAECDAVNEAPCRVVASRPTMKVMPVYVAVKDVTDPGVPAYMLSLAVGTDAEEAFAGFLGFREGDWLREACLKLLPATSAPRAMQAIDKLIVTGCQRGGHHWKAAAVAHHTAIKRVDTTSANSTADYEGMKAVDKMIVMDGRLDGNLLQEKWY